jgi:hypothetical protein
MIPLVYIVWDTYKNRLWVSPRGRCTWAGPGHAKASWENHEDRNFHKQARYQVHEATLVRGLLVDTKEVK